MAPAAARTTLYVVLAAAGTALPLAAFLPWLSVHGLDPARFVADLFANRVSAFFGLDVIVAAIVSIAFITIQGARDAVPKRGWAIAATLLVGVSCGLPLFLALRERALAPRSVAR